jgi:hypothetical protein
MSLRSWGSRDRCWFMRKILMLWSGSRALGQYWCIRGVLRFRVECNIPPFCEIHSFEEFYIDLMLYNNL